MKYHILYIALALLSVSLISCRQNEGHIGPIFGKWQLKEIQSENSVEVFDSIFYNFQWEYTALERIYPEHVTTRLLGFFRHNDDELILHIPHLQQASLWQMSVFQMPDTLVAFKVQELTNKSMILQLDDETIYRFRKFGFY